MVSGCLCVSVLLFMLLSLWGGSKTGGLSTWILMGGSGFAACIVGGGIVGLVGRSEVILGL